MAFSLQGQASKTIRQHSGRLDALGVPSPGWYRSGTWHQGVGDKRMPAAGSWAPKAVSNIVRQRAYSGVHEVRFKGEEEAIERHVPPILDAPVIQDRAIAALLENGRRHNRGGTESTSSADW